VSIWRTSTGSSSSNVRHAAIARDESKVFLDRAFRRDFDVNGPSLFRLMASMLTGWRRYRDDGDDRVRARVRGVVGDGEVPARVEPGRERPDCRPAEAGGV
jgi:hypothetical protein